MDGNSEWTPNNGEITPSGDEPGELREIPFDLFCQWCGYNLRALTSDRCPECGRSLETVRSSIPLIPWVHRRRIGRFRAYWKTVWLVMFRQQLFCDEMARPVDYKDAQRFRWVTILHAYVPILLATVGLYLITSSPLFRARPYDGGASEFYNAAFAAVWPVGIVHLCILLFLVVATGVASYFFHPRGLSTELQNRAIALSYYASGALAITALPVAAGYASSLIALDNRWGMFLFLVAVTVPCGQLTAWLLDLIHLSRRTMPQFPRRAVSIGVFVPALWLLLAVLIFGGIGGLIFGLLVIVASLS